MDTDKWIAMDELIQMGGFSLIDALECIRMDDCLLMDG